jgi:hypothetical protein
MLLSRARETRSFNHAQPSDLAWTLPSNWPAWFGVGQSRTGKSERARTVRPRPRRKTGATSGPVSTSWIYSTAGVFSSIPRSTDRRRVDPGQLKVDADGVVVALGTLLRHPFSPPGAPASAGLRLEIAGNPSATTESSNRPNPSSVGLTPSYSSPLATRARFRTFSANVLALTAPSDKTLLT